MALKNSIVHLLGIILWLSLLLLFFGWCNLFSKDVNSINIRHHQVSISHQMTLSNRKVLANKFDFIPFLHHKHHWRHRPRHVPVQSEPSSYEIDPRYGVEKRLVPTGPNPLHHWGFFLFFFLFSCRLIYFCFCLWWSFYLFSSHEKKKKEEKKM